MPLSIAKSIVDLRRRHNISQEELAERLFVSRDLVSKWETGTRRPDWGMIERMAEVFNVPTSEIVSRNVFVYGELEKCLPKESRFSAEELAAVIGLFFDSLSENEVNIFIRRYYFFERIADIAPAFEMNESHIRSILSRMRKKLKRFIKEIENEKNKNV